MATDKILIEKREELKRRLAVGEYKTLVDIFLEWFNRLTQKITRRSKPLPLWLSMVILSLGVILIGIAPTLITGDRIIFHYVAESFGLGYVLGILSMILIVGFGIVTVFVINQAIGRIFILWRDDILDATESLSSLYDYEDWLKKICNLRLHFLTMIVVGLFVGIFAATSPDLLFGGFIGGAFIFWIIILNMLNGAFFYQGFIVLLLPAMLRRYDLKLFAADPATSELLSRLSGKLGFFVYFVAVYSAFSTLVMIALGAPQAIGIVFVLFLWLPIIAMFVLNQTSLSSMILRAKWKTLNEIQMKVEALQAAENFEEKEIMEAINRLMDYHDRVKATRDSALDFRTYLSLFNSLLLPLLAFILGNIDLVLKLFGIKP